MQGGSEASQLGLDAKHVESGPCFAPRPSINSGQTPNAKAGRFRKVAKQEGPQVRSRLPTSQQLHRQTLMDLLSKACSFQGECLESASQSVLVSVSFHSSSHPPEPWPRAGSHAHVPGAASTQQVGKRGPALQIPGVCTLTAEGQTARYLCCTPPLPSHVPPP